MVDGQGAWSVADWLPVWLLVGCLVGCWFGRLVGCLVGCLVLSLILLPALTRPYQISYAVFCLKNKLPTSLLLTVDRCFLLSYFFPPLSFLLYSSYTVDEEDRLVMCPSPYLTTIQQHLPTIDMSTLSCSSTAHNVLRATHSIVVHWTMFSKGIEAEFCTLVEPLQSLRWKLLFCNHQTLLHNA